MLLDPKNTKKILFFIAFGAACFAAFKNLGALLSLAGGVVAVFRPVITALCIAFVLNVLFSALENRVFRFMEKSPHTFVRRAKRPLCLVLTYLVAFGIIILLIAVIIPELIDTCVGLTEKLPSFMNDVRVFVEDTLDKFNFSQDLVPNIKIDWAQVAESIKNYLMNYSEAIFGSAYSITTSVFSAVYNTVFSIMISVYILACKEKIGSFASRCINAFAPKKLADTLYHLASITYNSFAKFIGGQLTEAVILGVLCFLGMTILRFPNAAIISIFICITSLVPIIGATVGVIVGFLLIFIVSPVKALLFLVFFVVLQQLEGSLIYPRVVGKSVGLPGVIVVCAVLVGGNIGGIFGALVGVPTSAVLYTVLREAVERRTQKLPSPPDNGTEQ